MKATADARGVVGDFEQSAGVDHLSGVNEVTDNLIVRVDRVDVRACGVGALFGVFGIDRLSQPVKITDQVVCHLEDLIGSHFVSFRVGIAWNPNPNSAGKGKATIAF